MLPIQNEEHLGAEARVARCEEVEDDNHPNVVPFLRASRYVP